MPIQSVAQQGGSFYTEAGANLNNYGGNFLSYDSASNSYSWGGYSPFSESPAPIPVATIADALTQKGADLFGSTVGGMGQTGDIHTAAAMMGGFTDVVGLIGAPKIGLAGLALGGYNTYTDVTKGLSRAEVYAKAESPNATIADKLAAYEAKPSILGVLGDIAMTGLSAFTGDVLGTGAGTLKTAADIHGRYQSDRALSEAGQMAAEQTSQIGSMQNQYGIGPTAAAQMASNFQAQQSKNLEAAQTTSTTGSLVSATARGTIAEALGVSPSSQFGTQGETGMRDHVTTSTNSQDHTITTEHFSGGGSFSQDITANKDTQSNRDSTGYSPSSASDRQGFTSRDMGSFI